MEGEYDEEVEAAHRSSLHKKELGTINTKEYFYDYV
jgi:hypothetical protein